MTIQTVGDKCCGCRTCQTACPVKAISFTNDKFGFEQPMVDTEKCIDCGKCTKVCPALNEVKETTPLMCGSAIAKDENTKMGCSSGGVFGALAQIFINEGGVVYGAAFDENHKLNTTCADSIEGLQPLYKSKYLLCNTSDKYKDIKADLMAGRKVLYCSSPCQIHALRLFLGKEYENLYCLDFVCHGVGSEKLWLDSVKYVEDSKKIKINRFTMRHKAKKPSAHYYMCDYTDLKSGKDKQKVSIYLTFPYYHAYEKRSLCRTSCYTCKFASPNRVGDITIGDFHTIETYEQNVDRFAGVSMFVCNTEKGKRMMEHAAEKFDLKEYDWSVIREENRFSPAGDMKMPASYETFLETANRSFDEATKRWLKPYKDYTYYYYKMPKFLRGLARKILIK